VPGSDQTKGITDNAPLRGGKGTLYEGGIRVPFFARWPGQIPAASTAEEPIVHVDMFPTFMELAGDGAQYPKDLLKLDGISLTPTFQGEKLVRRQPLCFQYGTWQSIRMKNWKLVQVKSEPWQLYDLSRDRTETRDLAKQFPERVESMERLWLSWYRNCTGKDWMPRKGKKTKRSRNKKSPL
ncbi:MAG: sulfatase/phosphatase domain-containing protein, partial [Opitutales bacterium]